MPKEHRSMVAKRFRVAFANILGERFAYYVCTCLDANKAIVLAAEWHNTERPEERVFEVLEVTLVDGVGPYGSDVVDRAEW